MLKLFGTEYLDQSTEQHVFVHYLSNKMGLIQQIIRKSKLKSCLIDVGLFARAVSWLTITRLTGIKTIFSTSESF
ncbi:MAG: hypothetical protein KZQ70_12820 [gamma proteobacterium symbiont of Lucinoma myriamae]|nr:hypothetical protein [gamma proteobacterium symbiont of Lucinoma myriamae]